MSTNTCSTKSIISWQISLVYASVYVLILTYTSFKYFKIDDTKYASSSLYKKMKIWILYNWNKRSCYTPLIGHFFDQITDIASIIELYIIATTKDRYADCFGLNVYWLFLCSICSMFIYRLISSYLIYQATQTWWRIFTQFFEFDLFYCLYINYALNKQRPCNPQRYINSIESVFEATPQTLIQFIFIIRTFSYSSNLIILISLFAS
eukprot:190710_1